MKTFGNNIFVTRTIFELGSRKVLAEEPVMELSLTSRSVVKMAQGLNNCIEKGLLNAASSGFGSGASRGKVELRQSEALSATNPIWFIGDLHGDLVALKTLTMFAEKQSRRECNTTPIRLCFLGDLVDGAPYSSEVVAWVMMRAARHRSDLQREAQTGVRAVYDQVLAVTGNHDEGLFFDSSAGGKFASRVSPSTFAEELNTKAKLGNSNVWQAFGNAAIDYFKGLPRMILMDRTLMLAHGGVPHSDVAIRQLKDLESPQASSDFAWNRLHESAPKKIPNRESKGSQQGVKDFEAFVSAFARVPEVSTPPRIFIRGHDHHDRNFKHYENYKGCAVLTLNAFTVNSDHFGQKYQDLAMLRWRPSEPDSIALFRFNFREGALDEIWRVLAAEKPNPGFVL